MIRIIEAKTGETIATAATEAEAVGIASIDPEGTYIDQESLNEFRRKRTVPASVTMAQAEIALQMAGLLEKVKAGLNGLEEPGRSVALVAWERSATISRNGALVQTLAGSFGFTDEQLDELFIQAGSIRL